MVNPVANIYSAASGATIWAGRGLVLPGTWMIGGDSITDAGYGSNVFNHALWARKPPLLLKNGAVFGRTLETLISMFPTEVLSLMPDNYAVRIGQNSISLSEASFTTKYRQLLDLIVDNGIFGVIHALTPNGSATPALRNAWIKEQCDADPEHLLYVADGLAIADGSYLPITPTYYDPADLIHPKDFGARTMGRGPVYDAYNAFLPAISVSDLLNPDPLDVYPTDPVSRQYIRNSNFTGTSGTAGTGITGAAPTGWSVTREGSATALLSIEPALAGDPDQAPWMRITPTFAAAKNDTITIVQTMQNALIPAGPSTARFDATMEVRFVNFDTAAVQRLNIKVHNASSGAVFTQSSLFLNQCGVINDDPIIARSCDTRDTALSVGANLLRLSTRIFFESAFSGSIGHIDFRRPTVKGSL